MCTALVLGTTVPTSRTHWLHLVFQCALGSTVLQVEPAAPVGPRGRAADPNGLQKYMTCPRGRAAAPVGPEGERGMTCFTRTNSVLVV